MNNIWRNMIGPQYGLPNHDFYLPDHEIVMYFTSHMWKIEFAVDEGRSSLVDLYEDDIPRVKLGKLMSWNYTPPNSNIRYGDMKRIINNLFDPNPPDTFWGYLKWWR